MPAAMRIAAGATADPTQAPALIADIPAGHLLADRGYDANAVLAAAETRGMNPVMPPRRSRKEPREYDRHPYRWRHPAEDAFRNFKEWSGMAARYAKSAASYLAACQVRALMLWSKLF